MFTAKQNWIYMTRLVILISFILLASCSNSTEPAASNSTTKAPEHTVNIKGVLHKSGYSSATINCISCHGADLKGGTAGVSCYNCHGKKWS